MIYIFDFRYCTVLKEIGFSRGKHRTALRIYFRRTSLKLQSGALAGQFEIRDQKGCSTYRKRKVNEHESSDTVGMFKSTRGSIV